MSRFCVECGRETEELTPGSVCRACFTAAVDLLKLPQQVDVEVCAHCGARKRGETWQRPPADDAEPVELAALEAAELDPRVRDPRLTTRVERVDPLQWRVTVAVAGTAEGFDVEDRADATVLIRRGTCLKCSRFRGGYFEGIVQVRARDRPLDPDELRETRVIASRVIDQLVDQGDPNAFVLRDEEVDGGLDVYVGTIPAGRAMARAIGQRFGARLSEHPKLVGQRDGVDMYRITFSVRLAPFRVGDLVVVDGRPWWVGHIGTKRVTLHDLLAPDVTRSAERDHLRGLPVVHGRDVGDAVIVTRSDQELEIMDPVTYATLPVRRPEGVLPEHDTVPVVRLDGDLVPVSPDLVGRARAAT